MKVCSSWHTYPLLGLPFIAIQSFLSPESQMRSSFAGLFPSFVILTSAFTLGPSLSLINPNATDISNYNNQTFPSLPSPSGITCTKVYGQNLDFASCRNALEKIHRSSQSHRFTQRLKLGEKPTANQIETPIRYLSDNGICAVVRHPYFLSLFHCLIVVLQSFQGYHRGS